MLSEVQYQGAQVVCHVPIADEGAKNAASRFGLLDEFVHGGECLLKLISGFFSRVHRRFAAC